MATARLRDRATATQTQQLQATTSVLDFGDAVAISGATPFVGTLGKWYIRRTFNDLARLAGVNPVTTKALTGHVTERMRDARALLDRAADSRRGRWRQKTRANLQPLSGITRSSGSSLRRWGLWWGLLVCHLSAGCCES